MADLLQVLTLLAMELTHLLSSEDIRAAPHLELPMISLERIEVTVGRSESSAVSPAIETKNVIGQYGRSLFDGSAWLQGGRDGASGLALSDLLRHGGLSIKNER